MIHSKSSQLFIKIIQMLQLGEHNSNPDSTKQHTHAEVNQSDEYYQTDQQTQIQHHDSPFLQHTIEADIISNRRFIITHFKITTALLLIILFLKVLPSPLIIGIVENDPLVLSKQLCDDDQCSDVDEGYETITIKKINPLQRELKYFVRLNQKRLESMKTIFGEEIDLNQQITWIQIYAMRNNEIMGLPVYQKSGKDAYQIIFNGEALIFMGEVHVLKQISYSIRIYKKIRRYTVIVPNTRKLQNDNSTQFDNTTDSINTTNSTTPNQTQNNTKTQDPQPTQKTQQRQASAPLTVQLVRYSQFFTGTELLIRYITFLFILYVRADTINCPTIFHIILFFTANPLIFTQIAFPNTVSNFISNMCSSMYILYVGIFLYYTHRRLKNSNWDIIFRVLKISGIVCLYIVSIFRQLHLVNQIWVELIQYVLIILVLTPLINYLWRIYFFKSKTILHRNLIFILLALYYFLLLFFSGYIVDYGWKKIAYYLIILAYGVNMCYLTNPKILPNLQEVPQTCQIKRENQMTIPFSPQNHDERHPTENNNDTKIQKQPEQPEQLQQGQPQPFVKID